MDNIKKVCKNCDSFIQKEKDKSFCSIRYLNIDCKDNRDRRNKPVKENDTGCEVFMYKTNRSN